MNIGFDAKRAFHNSRGLGNYSRDTIRILGTYFNENVYILFNPKVKNNIPFQRSENTHSVTPNTILGTLFPSIWRSIGICKSIKKQKLDIYHGLSQELPWGIKKTGAKSIVTMHDAIFMRYPELYSRIYRAIFIKKNKYACKNANHIIAISEQTKRDIIKYFDAKETKISVVYQGCNYIFREPIFEDTKEKIRKKYNLPDTYILNVGAIEKRKNIALILEAMQLSKVKLHLLIVGKHTAYVAELKKRIIELELESQVTFLHNVETRDLPAIYNMAEIFIYPSIFEGFGIPILEALCTGTPVITSTGSCFEETGGAYSRYINPYDSKQLGSAINEIHNNDEMKLIMKAEGLKFAEKFTEKNIAKNLMDVYNFTLKQ